MDVDTAFERFVLLKNEIEPNLAAILSESDARLHIINRVFTEVLGWDFTDIHTEPHSPEGFADYLFSINDQPSLVVEAKKIGTLLVDTENKSFNNYKVSGPALKSCGTTFKQAAGYCLDHGPDLAIITTGDVWIFFIAFPRNGKSYLESRAIVFPNLLSIHDNFSIFFDLSAKASVATRLYRTVFSKIDGLSLRHIEAQIPVAKSSDYHMLARSELALDLEPVFKKFFSDLTGEADADMLTDCFVETKESRTADSALQKIIENVSANVQLVSTGTGEQLIDHIEHVVKTSDGDNILIVGSKGAGKSTFITRFFKDVISKNLRDQCVIVKLDFIGSKGDAAMAASEAVAIAKGALEAQLYEGGVPSYEQLQGMYYSEYQRWRAGPHKFLYEKDKEQFKINFGVFLEEEITREPFRYVTRMLDNIVKSRGLLPVIVYDNIDHHPIAYQEAIFQWSQAIREAIPFSLAILPITDRTVWRLSKHGPFQTHQSRVFYLPVPSTKAVLERRVAYLKSKVADGKVSAQYLLSHGIRLEIPDVQAFAATMEEAFIREDFVARRIGWLSNHDVRRGLQLTKSVATSPFLSIDELVGVYMTAGAYRPLSIKHRKFMQALVLGSYNLFWAEAHEFILNVFETPADFPTSPLLALSILRMLADRQNDDEQSQSYLLLSQISDYFESMQIDDFVTAKVLQTLLDRRLVEPYDASDDEMHADQRLSITHSGRMHIELALEDPIYVAQMAFVTPLRSQSVVDRLRSIKAGSMGAAEWDAVRRDFLVYCHALDRTYCHIPSDPMFDGQRELRRHLQGRWVGSLKERAAGQGDRRSDQFLAELSDQKLHDRLETTLKFFDPQRNFGFVDGHIGEDIYLPGRLLADSGFPTPASGSVIVCDVAPGKGGKPQAIAIYAVEEGTPGGNFVPGIVKFFDAKKGFGFVIPEGSADDVYLSFKHLKDAGLHRLDENQSVEVIVGPEVRGRGKAVQAIRLPT